MFAYDSKDAIVIKPIDLMQFEKEQPLHEGVCSALIVRVIDIAIKITSNHIVNNFPSHRNK